MKLSAHTVVLFRAVCWSFLGGAILVLLVAAVRVKHARVCKTVVVDIKGPETGEWFVEKKEVMNLLTGKGANKLQGQELRSFNLQQMEIMLKKNVWVKTAQVYFDSKNVLHIKIRERAPVARVFTANGSSFYIDSSLKRLPLSDQTILKLPVFTGFPTDRQRFKKTDSILLWQVRRLSEFIQKDPFWRAQIAQVDITLKKEFELIPTIGNHIIVFGKGEDIEKKFRKLRLFYEQVSAKAGFDKYSVINIQFNGQVIGVRRENQRAQLSPTQITIQNNNN